MVNRVLIDANNFKVSKPGIDVLTANNSQLIIRNNSTSLGIMQTGTFTESVIDGYYAYNTFRPYFFEYLPVSHAIINPTGFLPLMLHQRIDNSNSSIAWGGGFYMEYSASGAYVDQSGEFDTIGTSSAGSTSGHWVVFLAPDGAKCIGGGGGIIANGIDEFFFRSVYQESSYRYNAFFTKSTEDDQPPDPKDRIPNAISFNDKINTTDAAVTNSQTISGVDAGFFIEATLSSSLNSGASEKFTATRIETDDTSKSVQVTSGNSVLLDVLPGSSVSFMFEGTAAKLVDVTLKNVNNGNNILDTFTLGVNSFDYYPDPLDFSNLTGSGYDIGNTVTVTGINTATDIRIELPTILSAGQYLAIYKNSVITLQTSGSTLTTVFNDGDDVSFAIYSHNGYSGTVTVRNLENNEILDTFTSSISSNNSIPDIIPNLDSFSASSVTNITTDTTNSISMTGYSGSATMKLITLTLGVSDGPSIPDYTMNFVILSNGSVIKTIPSGSTDNIFSFPVGASLSIRAELNNSDTTGITVTGTATLSVNAGGQYAFLDNMAVNMYAAAAAGGGGGPGGGGFGGI